MRNNTWLLYGCANFDLTHTLDKRSFKHRSVFGLVPLARRALDTGNNRSRMCDAFALRVGAQANWRLRR